MAAGLAVSVRPFIKSTTCCSFYFQFSLTADEFLYQNQWGEIALLTVGNLSERILMSNTTYVSAVFTFSRSPVHVRLCVEKSPFNHSTLLCEKLRMIKSFCSWKGHLFVASFVIVDVNLFTSDKKNIKSLGFWGTLLLVSTSSNSLSNFFFTSSFSPLNLLAEALGERRRCVGNRKNEENITVYEAELTSLPLTESFLSASEVPTSWFFAVESFIKCFNLI